MNKKRLEKQVEFIVEIDKLKHILRRTYLMDNSRHENDVEHSWHLAMMVLLLSEYANSEKIDILHVLRMVLIHDIVEIDAGDTFCYDAEREKGRLDKEEKAAQRLFRVKHRKIDLMEAEIGAPGREISYIIRAQDEFGK